ncbi:MAG: apolipoprotein N-acyltransferase [Planctomycetota bacterium]|nr:MAG: apolipoprotein N-acyltransferase [Planctomycetota bacterium]
MNADEFKGVLLTFFAFCVSAVLLTVIQVPFEADFLAWVALVPFILICSPDAKPWRLVWISYLVSLIYWLGNLYWIAIVTVPAYILFCMYLGLYWPLLALCVRYCRKKVPVPLFLVVPMLFVGAEAWQGILITGFNWRLLAHSQYANLSLIQIADIFGATGVSFIIAMVNGLSAGLVIEACERKVFRTANILKTVFVFLILLGTMLYGKWRIGQAEEFTRPGPVVGSVQSNVPSNIKELAEAGDEILADVIKRSEACIEAGAKLVVWPETIVLTTLNKDYLELCPEDSRPVVFDKIISEHTKERAYVLLGAHSATMDIKDNEYVVADRFNSAFLYGPDGEQDPKRYDKIHLVPFGEYIPFRESIPFIADLVVKLSPYDYDYHLTHGRDYTIFEMVDGQADYGFGVLICYEDTDPVVTRKIVVGADGAKRADWLVNISNDGWYVRFINGEVLPSVELGQRTAISVFRAVENRISIIRSVNAGISCLIDSVGRIKDGFLAGDLPVGAMERQGVGGWFVDRIAVDKRVTFFSRCRRWLDFSCATVWSVVIILALRQIFKDSK